jgi:hypothetical protein
MNQIQVNFVKVAAVPFVLSAVWVLYVLEPEASRLYPSCPSKLILGLDCPGCGTLRALHNLLNANFLLALSYNPLMVVSIPVLIHTLFRPKWVQAPAAPWIVLAVLAAYTALRNIPIFPFSLLAPGLGVP